MVGDEDSLRELLELAALGLERDIPQIAQRLEQGDAKGANQLLHAIKGFVPIFCTAPMTEHVTQVEFLSKTASAQELLAPMAQLAPQLRQLHAEINAYLQTQARNLSNPLTPVAAPHRTGRP